MIVLYKGQDNTVVLTLNESSRLVNPFYLFEIISDFEPEQEKHYFTGVDLSTNVCRYNLFLVQVSVNGLILGGADAGFTLKQGQYSYNVYESETPTLDVTQTTGRILETGRLMVIDTATNTTINNNNDVNSIYI